MLTRFHLRQNAHCLIRISSKVISPHASYSKTSQTQTDDKLESNPNSDKTTNSKSSTGRQNTNGKISNTVILSGIPVNKSISPSFTPQQEKQGLPDSRKKQDASTVNITTTREHFLPLTRPSLIRLLSTDNQLIDNDEDRSLFHQLCEGFDSVVVQRYHPILNELKNLFNPLNPDNETTSNRRLSERERLDNEYWLIEKINDLLHRSNFTELPRNILLERFLIQEDKSSKSSNVNIKINGYDYDVLKFWILGREQMPSEELPFWKRLFRTSKTKSSNDYFKRIIVAVRLKGQERLYLKAFRDIPLQSLPQLLPVGKLQMGHSERRLIRSTFFMGTSTAVAHLITTMAEFHIPGLVIGGSSLTLLLALWSFRNTYRSKINYLSSINRILFYKNIASNKQLLAMIIDRAEDELSKEILLVYLMILSKQKQNIDLNKNLLELDVENWIQMKTNSNINFNSDQSIELLRKLGIILPEDPSKPDRLQVIPYKQVAGILPKISRSLSEKNEEWDLIEGYDKKYFEVDWKTVLNEEKIVQKAGWR